MASRDRQVATALSTFIEADIAKMNSEPNMQRALWILRSTSRNDVGAAMADALICDLQNGKTPDDADLLSLLKRASEAMLDRSSRQREK